MSEEETRPMNGPEQATTATRHNEEMHEDNPSKTGKLLTNLYRTCAIVNRLLITGKVI